MTCPSLFATACLKREIEHFVFQHFFDDKKVATLQNLTKFLQVSFSKNNQCHPVPRTVILFNVIISILGTEYIEGDFLLQFPSSWSFGPIDMVSCVPSFQNVHEMHHWLGLGLSRDEAHIQCVHPTNTPSLTQIRECWAFNTWRKCLLS